MIKAFAPLLGNFQGHGMSADGTELVCRFQGNEMLNNLCYGLRIEVLSQDNQNHLVNAFVTLSTDDHGKLKMHYVDAREHANSAQWTAAAHGKATLDSRIFSFEGQRTNGSFYRIHFDIISAENFKIYMESAHSQGDVPHEDWSVHLKRERSQVYPLRAA